MKHNKFSRRQSFGTLSMVLTLAAGMLLAHEGHAPLPTSGTEVDIAKGQLTLSAEARAALDVQTADVNAEPPPASILAYATLVAPWQNHAFATSRLGGRISAVHARSGAAVKAGELLAAVESQEIEQLRLDVLAARTDVRQAEQVLDGLKGSPAVTGQQVLDAETQLSQSRNAVEVATSKWLALGLPKEGLDGAVTSTPALPIRASVSGTVIHSDLAVGHVVEAGQHLFEIVDHSTVWARIGVLERDLLQVYTGQHVELKLTAYPAEPIRGTIDVVDAALDPETHLCTVWAVFTNPSGQEPRLLPGMSGQARIELPVTKGAKSVPAIALVNDGVDRFVLVEVANSTDRSEFQRKSVIVVREGGGIAVIRSPDLFQGDRVVTRGSHELGGLFAPGIVRLTAETRETLGLNVGAVGYHSIEDVVEVPGIVELPPDRRTVAASPLAGTLVSVRVDRGQKVSAGQVLGEVFSLDFLTLQLDLLKEALAADLLGQQLRQLRTVPEGVSRQKLVNVEAAAAASTNRRDSHRRRLAILGMTPSQLDALIGRREIMPSVPVRSSITGTLVSFDKVLGQSVRADEALFEVHNLSRAWVHGFASEREVPRVRIDQTSRIRLVSDPIKTLTGKVVRSGRIVGPSDRTLSVWVELDHEPDPPLRHNQMGRMTLTVESRPATLAVPLAAVARDGVRSFVFIRKADMTFDRRAVELGRSDDRHVEVRSGLSAGEEIAITSAEELQTAYASVR